MVSALKQHRLNDPIENSSIKGIQFYLNAVISVQNLLFLIIVYTLKSKSKYKRVILKALRMFLDNCHMVKVLLGVLGI